MKMRWHKRHICAALVAAGFIGACAALVGPAAQAGGLRSGPPPAPQVPAPAPQVDEPLSSPLIASDFMQAAPRGFDGDRNNSWAQSMAWWQKHLYVGTSRAMTCLDDFSVWIIFASKFGVDFTNRYFPYPPLDPDLSCAPDGSDLPIRAEIWRWTPPAPGHEGTWTRVYQSPLAIDNPGQNGTAPSTVHWQGKKLPYEVAFRGMAPFTEPDGTEALYAFGVNSGFIWNPVPNTRILRTTDGTTFTPLPQTPGTLLGDLNQRIPGTSSFRSPVSYNGKLFVLAGAIQGQGTLIASADPAKSDKWFIASPKGMLFYDMAVFNGYLYLGGFAGTLLNPTYTVVKTKAEGPPPYTFIPVVPSGAYLTPNPSQSVVSMHEYFGRLYVGTAGFTEVIRINRDDTWDLVVGPPRAVPGSTEIKYPISGLDNGWGDTLNDHAWQMDDFDGNLYIGTFNASTGVRCIEGVDPDGDALQYNMGANLYRTHDGWYQTAVTTNGFSAMTVPTIDCVNLSKQHGGIFDYGIRSMANTPYGFFLGTTNDYFGLAIFRGTFQGLSGANPPDRVEIEQTRNGSALLSWLESPAASRYRIWRASRNPIHIRGSLSLETIISPTGGAVPDVYIGQYVQIGVSLAPFFIDKTVQPGQRYMYYVQAEDETGKVSEQSNLVAFPLLTPPLTFVQLLHEVDVLDQRKRYKNPATKLMEVRQEILDAQALAARCQIGLAIDKLNPEVADSDVLEPDSTDLEILISKLVRRLQLFARFPNDVVSSEFCSTPTISKN